MARIKRGEEGCDKAVSKWRKTMLERYGGEEGLHEKMQSIGSKGGSLSKSGGFASKKRGKDGLTGPERARLVGAIGGFRSCRLGVKNGEGKKRMVGSES